MDPIANCPLCGMVATCLILPQEKGKAFDFVVECGSPSCGCRLCLLGKRGEKPFEKTFSLGRWEFTLRRKAKRKYLFATRQKRLGTRDALFEEGYILVDVRSETSADAIYMWNHAVRNQD